MTKKRKKIKLKKAPFIIIIILVLSLVLIISISNKNSSSKNEITENQKNSKVKKSNEKLKELNYINEKLDYFNNDYIDRYLTYKKENPNLPIKKVIINVNIGLDYPYYENSHEAKYLNTSYLLVNKYNYLPENYIPDNLVTIDSIYSNGEKVMVDYAKDAFEKLASTAKNEGYNIYAMSTYRSYNYQVGLYNRYVSEDGKESADTYSARPGYSEHQTGLTVDVYNKEKSYTDFDKTKEYTWMQDNAHKFGFILRYPKDKVSETGYTYESWHYRYVGEEIATYIHEHNISFEEYFVRFLENKNNP